MDVFEVDRIGADFEQITVSTSAIGCTSSKLNPTSGDYKGMSCKRILVRVETDQVRYRIDGTDPTSTVGQILYKRDIFIEANPQNIAKFKAIRDTGSSTSATLNVEYYY